MEILWWQNEAEPLKTSEIVIQHIKTTTTNTETDEITKRYKQYFEELTEAKENNEQQLDKKKTRK